MPLVNLLVYLVQLFPSIARGRRLRDLTTFAGLIPFDELSFPFAQVSDNIFILAPER